MNTLLKTFIFATWLLLTSCCIFNQNINNTSIEWKGRYSVRINIGEHKEFFSGKFRILIDTNSTHTFLYGPLGILFAKITEDGQKASLERINQETIQARNVEELTQKIFGIHIPMQFLSEWLKKELLQNPPPTKPSTTFIHNNWKIVPLKKNGVIKKITFQPINQNQQNSFVITLIID